MVPLADACYKQYTTFCRSENVLSTWQHVTFILPKCRANQPCRKHQLQYYTETIPQEQTQFSDGHWTDTVHHMYGIVGMLDFRISSSPRLWSFVSGKETGNSLFWWANITFAVIYCRYSLKSSKSREDAYTYKYAWQINIEQVVYKVNNFRSNVVCC
jgi:hypothetical protein